MWWLLLFISSGTKNWFHTQPRLTLEWDPVGCLTSSVLGFSVALKQGHRRGIPSIKGSNEEPFILLFGFWLILFRGNGVLQTEILGSFIIYLNSFIFLKKEKQNKIWHFKIIFSHVIVKRNDEIFASIQMKEKYTFIFQLSQLIVFCSFAIIWMKYL